LALGNLRPGTGTVPSTRSGRKCGNGVWAPARLLHIGGPRRLPSMSVSPQQPALPDSQLYSGASLSTAAGKFLRPLRVFTHNALPRAGLPPGALRQGEESASIQPRPGAESRSPSQSLRSKSCFQQLRFTNV